MSARPDPATDEATTAPANAPSRLTVQTGGTPSAEELAAILVALTPTGTDGPDVPAVPAWTVAALTEGVGGPPMVRPSDLESLDRPR